MAKITYIHFDGTETVLDVKPGLTVMDGAVKDHVRGIDAECGGACSCATCHVFVDEAWMEKTGERTDTEKALFDFTGTARLNSRLSCQIQVTQELDGLVVRMPKSQR
jgi:2Fe-2S ferredoxin